MIATQDPNPWVGPAIIAAAIAALVAIVTVIVNGVLQRRDRQRQLMAEAFEKVQAYREFIFVVRRRLPDDAEKAAEDRTGISKDLSQLQARLNSLTALLKVEAPRVGAVYADLVAHTRRIAGAHIRAAWQQPSGIATGQMNITDVDLSALSKLDDAYLATVRGELALAPRSWILRRRGRRAHRQALDHLADVPETGQALPD
jgi:hypothetical protein